MDLDPRNSLLNWTYLCQGKGVEEMRQILLCANLELQAVRQQAQEEIRKRDDELRLFKDIISKAVKERDEAQDKLQQLLVQKFSFQNHQVLEQQEHKQVITAPASGVTSIEGELKRGLDSNNGFSSSEGDESIVSSPVIDTLPPPPLPPQTRLPMSRATSFHDEMMELLLQQKQPLPEKGKLLEAVMNAGPLLQTLILAGPLPQWRHPPPPLESSQIPPVAIPSPNIAGYGSLTTNCGGITRKRSLYEEGSASSTKNKYQRIILN